MKRIIWALVAVTLAGCSRNQRVTEHTQWEYKVMEEDSHVHALKDALVWDRNDMKGSRERRILLDSISGSFANISSQLSELGNDGWELTGVFTEVETVFPDMSETGFPKTDFQSNTRTSKEVFIFKRPKS